MFTVKQLAFDGMQVWGVACYKHIFRCLSGPFSIQRRHLRLNRLEHLGWTSGRVLNQNDFCRCCLLSAKLEWTIGFVRETDCLMEIGFLGPGLKDACFRHSANGPAICAIWLASRPRLGSSIGLQEEIAVLEVASPIAFYSPQNCVGFLFLDLHPPGVSASSSSSSSSASSSSTLSHTQLCHTKLCHMHIVTYNFVTHNLVTHTQIVTHTQLCHTQLYHRQIVTHTQLCHTPSLSHTIFHIPLCHTPSFTHLCHTPSFTHRFVTRNFVTHRLSHTTLLHTIFHTHTQFCHRQHCHTSSDTHTQLCHTPSFTHTQLCHTHTHTSRCHTQLCPTQLCLARTHTHNSSHTTFRSILHHLLCLSFPPRPA